MHRPRTPYRARFALPAIVERMMGAEEFARESARQLAQDVVAATVGVPYFVRSRRVKATFTNWAEPSGGRTGPWWRDSA